MFDLPRTPQTLPCGDDEDPFFVFRGEDASVDDSVGVSTIGMRSMRSTPEVSSSHAFFMPNSGQAKEDYRHTVRKELDFDAFTSKHTPIANDDVSTKSSRSFTLRQSMKNKRRMYRSKTFSRSNLLPKIKTAISSPKRKSMPLDKAGWQRTSVKGKTKLYHFLEDDESPLLPDDLDDRSCSLSLPSRIMTSMSRKKRSSASSVTSASTASLAPRASKTKWNKLIMMDSLSTFKATPQSTPPSIAKATRSMAAMELASSSSTQSSGTSSLGGRRSFNSGDPAKRAQLESRLKQGLYNARVDEEEDEDSDSEGDDHPEAGSFAFAIRRRESKASF